MPLSDKPLYVTGNDGLPARISGPWALRKHHYLSPLPKLPLDGNALAPQEGIVVKGRLVCAET